VKENPEGYDENSKDFMEALAQAKKQFEMQIYPNKNHGIYGGNPSIHHLYQDDRFYFREPLGSLWFLYLCAAFKKSIIND